MIFTSNYGEASAINVLGHGTGLPVAVSGHNTYWWWGPGNPRATTVVAVMSGIRANGEFGGQVYLCTGPRHPWGQMWPQLRTYS